MARMRAKTESEKSYNSDDLRIVVEPDTYSDGIAYVRIRLSEKGKWASFGYMNLKDRQELASKLNIAAMELLR